MKRTPSTDSTESPSLDGHEHEEEYPLPIPDHFGGGVAGGEDDYAFSSDSGVEEDEPWGLYRAVYPFEAVGEHEMGMDEGDLVDLRGRGGGDGWVVGVKKVLGPDGKVVALGLGLDQEYEEKEGLVPESYLEKVDLKLLLRERRAKEATSSSSTATTTGAGTGTGTGTGGAGIGGGSGSGSGSASRTASGSGGSRSEESPSNSNSTEDVKKAQGAEVIVEEPEEIATPTVATSKLLVDNRAAA